MAITDFLTTPCILRLRDPSGEEDAYGNELQDDAEMETVCELQQRRRDEGGGEGEVSDTLWDLFLPAGTELDTGDAVEVDGQVYELVGAPWAVANPKTRAASHVEATVRRVAGAENSS